MLLGVSGQTLAGFCHRPRFYRTEEQSRVFDKFGKRIYQEGKEQMVEGSSEEEEVELGVEKLPENDSDDEVTPLKEIAERQQRMAKQGESETILEQTPGVMREGGNADGDNGSDDDGDDEQEEDDEDMSEFKIQALQAKHKIAELRRRQELAERCKVEVLKIRKATEKGGKPPTPNRKTSRDLKVKKTSKTTHRGKKVIATKVPRAPARSMPSTSQRGGTSVKKMPWGGGVLPTAGGIGVKKFPMGGGALPSRRGRPARGGGRGASRLTSGRAGGGPQGGGARDAAAQQKKRSYRP